MQKIFNPFTVSAMYIGDRYFCDRDAETGELVSNILNARNTVLVSPRRMGKSGLVEHVFFQKAVKENFRTFNVDIMSTGSREEFTYALVKNVLDKMQPLGRKFKEAFVSAMKSLSASFTLDLSPLTVRLDYRPGMTANPETTLEELFAYLDSLDKPCVLAIDEFQQIAEYPDGVRFLAFIRSLVQKSRQTRFIFSGSNRRMMEKLFTEPSEPFFQSCSPLNLEAIGKKEYFLFAREHFRNAGKEISEECFNDIYDKFAGHTWYVQYILNRLFETTEKGETAGKGDVMPALEHILELNDRNFSEHFSRLSDKKRNLLVSIALNVPDKDDVCGSVPEITSADFISKYNLGSASSVQSALRPLRESETVTLSNGRHEISNKFFSVWLLRKFSSGRLGNAAGR